MNNKKISRLSKKHKSKNKDFYYPTFSSLQDALIFDFHNSVVPFKKIAQTFEMSPSRLAAYLSCPKHKPFKFASRHLLPGMIVTQSFAVLQFLAIGTGHAILRIPDKDFNTERLVPVILDFSDAREELEKELNIYLHIGDTDSLKKYPVFVGG